jgi:dTDP-4-dehydrorhamnose reductase
MNLILGDGLLGSQISKQSNWQILSRKKDNIDALEFEKWSNKLANFRCIINCIAFTETYSNDYNSNWKLNVEFINKLIDYCNENNKKLIQISTDYIYSGSISEASENDVPVHLPTWYGYTKLIGDAIVQLRCKKFLICRLSHKPNPFPYDKAWNDMFCNTDYVDHISEIVIKLIEDGASGIFNVGSEKKTIYELATTTRVDVIGCGKPEHFPSDTTMNLDKLNIFLNTKSSE